jgi:hypothetical protein
MAWTDVDEQLYLALNLDEVRRADTADLTQFRRVLPCRISEIVMNAQQKDWTALLLRKRWLTRSLAADPLNPLFLLKLILYPIFLVFDQLLQLERYLLLSRNALRPKQADAVQLDTDALVFTSAVTHGPTARLSYRQISAARCYADAVKLTYDRRAYLVECAQAPTLFVELRHRSAGPASGWHLRPPRGFYARCAAEKNKTFSDQVMKSYPERLLAPSDRRFQLPMTARRAVGIAVIALIGIMIYFPFGLHL